MPALKVPISPFRLQGTKDAYTSLRRGGYAAPHDIITLSPGKTSRDACISVKGPRIYSAMDLNHLDDEIHSFLVCDSAMDRWQIISPTKLLTVSPDCHPLLRYCRILGDIMRHAIPLVQVIRRTKDIRKSQDGLVPKRYGPLASSVHYDPSYVLQEQAWV